MVAYLYVCGAIESEPKRKNAGGKGERSARATWRKLKRQLQGQLEDSGIIGSRNLAKGSRGKGDSRRRPELGVIEDVEGFDAEDELGCFANQIG